MTATEYKRTTNKTWARIAAELTEQAMGRDPDKMRRIYEGRLWRLIKGAISHGWERRALEDLCGEGATFD